MAFDENMVFGDNQTNLSSSDQFFCGAVEDNKHRLLFLFYIPGRKTNYVVQNLSILPNFLSLTISKQVFILLNVINLDRLLPDPQNRIILLAVQIFITQTNHFPKHYE